MVNDQRIRAILFYLSVLVFFTGLPFILSFALGYKFDPHTFKFTRTGLIFLKTQPVGADIYLEEKILNEKTPTSIEELLPGKYNIKLELDKHYPWSGEAWVEAGKVTRLEKIILFPLRPLIKKLNPERLSSFWLDEEKNIIYYVNEEDGNIYRSDLEGVHYEKIATCLSDISSPLKYKLSGDREKILYFNKNKIGISFSTLHKELLTKSPSFIIAHQRDSIIDIFWHSDSYHLILISNKHIEVLEARPDSLPIILVNLNKKNASAFYDIDTDTIYFIDSQRAPDGNFYDNLYKLRLESRLSPLEEFRKLRTNDENQKD
jgi:hypothetical protein